MPDKWGDYHHQDKIWDGVTYHVKYLGNTLVAELDEEGQSYGDSISADAVKTIVAMAKASGKKLPKMSILVSPRGICVTNTDTQEIFTDLDVYRICFCTADRDHPKVFAYIARNRENETMECQAFLCSKRKIAESLTLTVAESFKLAQEKCEEEEKQLKERKRLIAAQRIANHTTTLAETHAELLNDEQTQGFDDNFSDFPVLSCPPPTSHSRDGIDPCKTPEVVVGSVSCSEDKSRVVAMPVGFTASPSCNALRIGPVECNSQLSANQLLCL